MKTPRLCNVSPVSNAHTAFHHSTALASSIHTIYRPLARSRKRSPRQDIPENHPETEPSSDEIVPSEDELDETEDFEIQQTPRPPDAKLTHFFQSPIVETPPPMSAMERIKIMGRTRTGSMATVRIQRRTMLAEKLKEVFELPAIDEVRAG